MSKETGGPAFPQHGATDVDGDVLTSKQLGGEGLSMRDHFAGLAMQGILSDPDAGLLDDDLNRYAGIAYRVADAMLRARGE